MFLVLFSSHLLLYFPPFSRLVETRCTRRVGLKPFIPNLFLLSPSISYITNTKSVVSWDHFQKKKNMFGELFSESFFGMFDFKVTIFNSQISQITQILLLVRREPFLFESSYETSNIMKVRK